MLECKDLMIGDLVKVHFGEPNKTIGSDVYGQVSELYDGGRIEVACNDAPSVLWNIENERGDEILPIHITPEILKKNGFVYADLPFEDFYEGYGLHIHGGNYADGHNNWYITCGINVSMNVTHVHELQHALRLCGIDKKITI